MASIFRENTLEYELRKSPLPEYLWHTSPALAEIAGSKQMDFHVRSLDPGKYSYPYHFHRNSEEIFVILSGKVMLRTPQRFQELTEGDFVFFELGPDGAHQLYNHTDLPCRFLDIRTLAGLDVCEYPDSGKINVLPERDIFFKKDKVGYYEGEDKVGEKWPAEITGRK